MPHITIVGVSEDRTQFVANPGTAVAPISTQLTERAGACYDGDGEALYAVYNTSSQDFECYVTTGGYRQLALTDDSVTYRSTIVTGYFNTARNVALQRIDGELYAIVAGVRYGEAEAGQWLYRDTSVAKDGSGPWAKHGTVYEIDPTTADQSLTVNFLTGVVPTFGRYSGEIVVMPDGNWVIYGANYRINPGNNLIVEPQVARSTDDGVTWSIILDLTFGLGNEALEAGGNWAKFGDDWYWGHGVSEANENLYYTANGTTYTELLIAGKTGSDTALPAFSDPANIYRVANTTLFRQRVAPKDDTDDSELETLVAMGDFSFPSGDPDTVAHFANIGPDEAPYMVAMDLGRVMGIGAYQGTGWSVGQHVVRIG